MSINQEINNFHRFLISSWPYVSNVLENLDWDESPYFLDNWIQANWELLIEKQLLESDQLLVPYGYNTSSGCRYKGTEGTLTHRVACHKKGVSEPQYYFLCFISEVDGVFKIEPPFDYIDVEEMSTGSRLSLPLSEVFFSIVQIR